MLLNTILNLYASCSRTLKKKNHCSWARSDRRGNYRSEISLCSITVQKLKHLHMWKKSSLKFSRKKSVLHLWHCPQVITTWASWKKPHPLNCHTWIFKWIGHFFFKKAKPKKDIFKKYLKHFNHQRGPHHMSGFWVSQKHVFEFQISHL